jgi:hypothetical protein
VIDHASRQVSAEGLEALYEVTTARRAHDTGCNGGASWIGKTEEQN